MQCFISSIVFHTFNCMSEKAFMFLLKLDYASICFIIAGNVSPLIYYCFYCQNTLFHVYFIFEMLTCSICFVVSMFDFIHTEEYRKLKGKYNSKSKPNPPPDHNPDPKTGIMYGTLGIVLTSILIHACVLSYYRNP